MTFTPVLAEEVAATLADGGPVVALETTLVSHGFPGRQGLEVARASEARVRAVDATGAGDAFASGYLLGGIRLGLDAAARAVTRMGAMP